MFCFIMSQIKSIVWSHVLSISTRLQQLKGINIVNHVHPRVLNAIFKTPAWYVKAHIH